MNLKKTCILLLVFCSAVSRLFAQHACTIKNFNAQNGLSQNTITSMMMDPSGHLWLGTHTGLVRYDGKDFADFMFATTAENASMNNVQYLMTVKADNKLLVRVRSGEVYVIDKAKPVLYNDSLKHSGFYTAVIGAFPNLSLFNRFNAPPNQLTELEGWNKHTVFLLPLNQTDFIVNSSQPSTLFYYKNGIKKTEITVKNNFKSFFSSGRHRFLLDNKWGMHRYDSNLCSFNEVSVDWLSINKKKLVPENARIYADEYSGNTYCFYDDTFYLLSFDENKNLIKFIPQFVVAGETRFWTGIIYDKISSSFFLSTLNEGFFQVKLQAMQTFNVNEMLPKNIDPIKTINYAVLKTSDSTTAIPSGFEFTDGHAGITVKKLGNLFGNRETIAMLPNKDILCGRSEGLFYFSASDGYTLKHVYNDLFNKINKYDITLLYPEGDSVWVGTRRGFFCVTPEKVLQLYQLGHDGKGAYVGPCLFYRLNNNEAYLSNMHGLIKITTSPPFKTDTIDAFKKKEVRHISPYKNVRILSVYKHGLWIEKDQQFYKVPVNGLSPQLLKCHSSYIDPEEGIWLPTDNGLYKTSAEMLVEYALQPQKGFPYFFRLSNEDGINNIEFNGAGTPSYAVLNNRLFYPSMGGIVTFRPEDVNTEMRKPPIFIDKVFIDEVLQPNTVADSIFLNAGFKYLSIEFAIPNFGETENLQVEYKMDNHDWVPLKLSDNGRLSLMNIASGRHQLFIRRRVGFKDTDYLYKTIIINKEKFIYETAWFYLLVLFLLASVTGLIIKLRTRSINRKRVILQECVDKQTSELSRAVEVKDLMIGVISHEMTTPLKHISVVAEVLQKGLEKNTHKVSEALSDIKLTSDRILSDSISLINWIKYSNKTVRVNKKTIHLYSLVKDVLETYDLPARNKGVQLQNMVERWRFIEADYTIIFTIFSNIVSNAVKYSSSGMITVYCEKDEANDTIVKISDEGSGMSIEILYKIREMLKGNLKVVKTYDESSTRLGYILVAELLRIHNLHIQVDSRLNTGTVVSIVLPQPG